MAEPATNTQRAGSERPVLAQELSTISVLVRRDLTRFFREKSRVVGALVQPLVFWLVIGSGMSSTFRLPGAHGVDYLEYFYPGVVVMVLLFTAIFTTMSVIEDRSSGFLQAVLVAPGSRTSVVLGKCAGAATVALVQGALFLLLAPMAGFPFGDVSWLVVLPALVLTCFSLCTLGFAVAWWLDSTAGYHVVMSLVLLPLWILSGAMFPGSAGFIELAQRFNPMAYAVSAVRRGLYGGAAPEGSLLAGSSLTLELTVLSVFTAVVVMTAVRVCHRRR